MYRVSVCPTFLSGKETTLVNFGFYKPFGFGKFGKNPGLYGFGKFPGLYGFGKFGKSPWLGI